MRNGYKFIKGARLYNPVGVTAVSPQNFIRFLGRTQFAPTGWAVILHIVGTALVAVRLSNRCDIFDSRVGTLYNLMTA